VVRRRYALVSPLVALVALTGFAMTATIVIEPSFIGWGQDTVTANELKPPECAAIDLGDIRPPQGAGGAGGAALTLGTPGNDRIVAGGHDDCILGGAGDDSINGGGGFDVCIGGPGVDTFRNCEVVFQ
jgi:Ca2+-binding RTX toxin-like protein